MYIGMFIGALVISFPPLFTNLQLILFIFAGFGVLIVLCSLLWGVLSLRCPYCEHGLPLRGGCINHCPYCGKPIK